MFRARVSLVGITSLSAIDWGRHLDASGCATPAHAGGGIYCEERFVVARAVFAQQAVR